jgi:hypothetical protein
MYKILLIETGEYLYKNIIDTYDDYSVIYSKEEMKIYRGSLIEATFSSKEAIEKQFKKNIWRILINNQPFEVNETTRYLFEIIEE